MSLTTDTIILGINAYHGDSSACILVNGELIAAFEEEPHQATDALVTGRSFKSLRAVTNQVYDWV